MHLVACDYDGTLLINGVVNKRDIKKIEEFRNKGNKFVICTGRPINSVLDELNKFAIPYDYIIGVNGIIAVDSDNKLLFKDELDKNAVESIHRILDVHNINDYVISNGFDQVKVIDNSDYTEALSKIIYVRGYYIDASSSKKALMVADELNNELNAKGVIAYPNNKYVAIGKIGIHKGYGVDKLIKDINFNGTIHVIGDDYNDIPMFKRFNSYGISSGIKEAITFADELIDSVHDALERIVK